MAQDVLEAAADPALVPPERVVLDVLVPDLDQDAARPEVVVVGAGERVRAEAVLERAQADDVVMTGDQRADLGAQR
jgi:hypothetical protein